MSAGFTPGHMTDEQVMLADLSFVECDECAGTGVTASGTPCMACSGEGTVPEWSGS